MKYLVALVKFIFNYFKSFTTWWRAIAFTLYLGFIFFLFIIALLFLVFPQVIFKLFGL